MPFVKVTMLKTAAGPEYVLLAGKTYRIDSELADRLMDETVKAAVKARSDAVVSKIPATPDPSDNAEKDVEVEEEDAE